MVKSMIRPTILTLLGVPSALVWQVSPAADVSAAGGGDFAALETIVVTAQKREEPLKDVAMSVTALSGAMLDNLQARDFSDYAPLVPGLSLASSQPGLTRLTLRGENAGGIGSTVAVYIDESPFGSSNALLNGATDTGDFDTWDMQRIEVLRGPQGTLYGANSEGGLLKFVSNAPVLGSFSVAGEVSGESVEHGGRGGDVHALVNLPLGNWAAFRVSGFDQDVAGYIDDPQRGVRNLNDGHKYGGRASVLLAPSDAVNVRVTAISQRSKFNGTNLVDIDPVTLQPLHGDLTQERLVAEPSSFKYENYNATIDWNAGAVRLVSTTSYGILEADTVDDVTPLFGSTASALLGGALPVALPDNVVLKKLTQEVRLSSSAAARLEWLVGGYFTREAGTLAQSLNVVQPPQYGVVDFIEQPNIDSTYKETAGFADLTYHINSLFDIQGGGRWSSNSQTVTETTIFNALILPTPEVINGTSSGNVFTYSLAPRWHVDANTMVFVRLATGYRPGGPNILPPEAPPTVQREYGADKTTNVELAVRSTQLQGRLALDIAAFHVNWKNIQLLEEVNGFGINGNGGTARSQGLEWSFDYLPLSGLTLQWTGAYTDAKLTAPAPALNASSGDPLPYAARFGTSLDGAYEWAAFAGFKGFLGVTWSYVGARSSDFAASAAAIPGQVVLPSYNTTQVRLGFENDRYKVTLFGKNLSDARAATNYFSSGAPYSTLTIIQPRTVGLTLSAKF